MKKFIKNIYKFIAMHVNFHPNVIYKTQIDNIPFYFKDTIISRMVKSVSKEINKSEIYDFRNLDFKDGDIVVDIGANIGIVSIYLAKKYPFLKIYAYEPVIENFNNFLENIKLNKIPEGTITAVNKAVTSNGRNVSMNINVINSGGSSLDNIIAQGEKKDILNTNIQSTTLEKIITDNSIANLKLLKIDCEGAEYEILMNTSSKILKSIEIIRGEYHENKKLTDIYDADKLLKYTEEHISNCKILISRDCFIM